MAVGTALNSDVWPERRSAVSSRYARLLAVATALAVAMTVVLVLPAKNFRASTLVAVTDTSGVGAAAPLKAAADAAVSEPVISDAAQSLIGTGYPTPTPSFFERVGLVFALDWVHPTSAEARLASDLAARVVTQPGAAPGTMDITATTPDPEQSARASSALAHAFVRQSETSAAQTRHRNEVEATQRLGRFKAEAIAARERFIALGGTQADPVQVHAAATAQVALAQARVDALRAIIASGSPPMSDRRDVPPSIEALQASYLDLSRQLGKALETLGERHTTVISLHDEIRRASTALSGEWRRLERMAEAELGAARGRERDASKAESLAADGRHGSLAEARSAMDVAESRIAQAERDVRDVSDTGRSTRVLAEATVPTRSFGFDAQIRWTLGALAGFFVFLIARRVPAWRARVTDIEKNEEVDASANEESPTNRSADSPRYRAEPMMPARPVTHHRRELDVEPVSHLHELVASLREIEPAFAVPTVMIAANEAGVVTTTAALAIARAASFVGRRVLLIAGDEHCADLAAAADPEAVPVVIDVFGRLRVGLRAEASEGTLYLAPGFADGARLAAGLAANRATRLIDDIAVGFDLLVIDGGQATELISADWGVDAIVRVATRLSARDDERLCASFDISDEALIGSFIGGIFIASVEREDARPMKTFGAPVGRSTQPRAVRTATTPRIAPVAPAMPRRKVGAR